MPPPSASNPIEVSDDDELQDRRFQPHARDVIDLVNDSGAENSYESPKSGSMQQPKTTPKQLGHVNRFGTKRRRGDDEVHTPSHASFKKPKLASDVRGNGLSAVNANARSLGIYQNAALPVPIEKSDERKPDQHGRPSRLLNVDSIDLTGSDIEEVLALSDVNSRANSEAPNARTGISSKDGRESHEESVLQPNLGMLSRKASQQSHGSGSKRFARPGQVNNASASGVHRSTSNHLVQKNESGSNGVHRSRDDTELNSPDRPSKASNQDIKPMKASGGASDLAKSLMSLMRRRDRPKESVTASAARNPTAIDERPQQQGSFKKPVNNSRLQSPKSATKSDGPGKLTTRMQGRETEKGRSERVVDRQRGNFSAAHTDRDTTRSRALFDRELEHRQGRAIPSDYTLDLDAQIAREVGDRVEASENASSLEDSENGVDRSDHPSNGRDPVSPTQSLATKAINLRERPTSSSCVVETVPSEDLKHTGSREVTALGYRTTTEAADVVGIKTKDACRQSTPGGDTRRSPNQVDGSVSSASRKRRVPGVEMMAKSPKKGANQQKPSHDATLEDPHLETDEVESLKGVVPYRTVLRRGREKAAQTDREPSRQLSMRPAAKVSARIHDSAFADVSITYRIEQILKQHMEEFHEDNDYWVRTWFKRARHSRDQAITSSQAAQQFKPTSVFSSMKPKRIVFSEPDRSPDEAVELKLEPSRSHNKQGKKFWMVQSDRINTEVQDLPNYSHYVSIKSNILASNDKVLHHWPYISEDPPEGIEGRFHEQYFIDKDDRQRKLRRMLQAETMAEYMEKVLQDIECDWSDVLRFLLEPFPEVEGEPSVFKARGNRQVYCDEDFTRIAVRWVKVLAELPASDPSRVGRAGLLCDEFQKVAKFSLWHIARRSDYVKERLPDVSSGDTQENLTCRVCMRFSCPYHGEIREKDDRRNGDWPATGDASASLRNANREDGSARTTAAEEVVHTDIINPPQVNFRQAVCFPSTDAEEAQQHKVTAKDRRSLYYWQTEFPNYQPEDRGPFYPCHHPGLSCKSAECSCFRSKVPCEKSCACAADCPRKFQGCSCAAEKLKKGQKLLCFEDERCLCYQLGRECDADLCGSCGVSHVLDPVHRHDVRRPGETCNNASLQRGVRKHTVLGESGVHGLGLYACEDVREHEYVDEYLGEIITINEGERRGAVYEYQKLSYLFSLNKAQDIDGTCFGNKARFINHAGKTKANLYARTRFVNTVYRVGLYATRNIKKGEELFFEYGDKFPDQQLEGEVALTKNKKPLPASALLSSTSTTKSKAGAAPHVRNTRLVRDEFYDVEQTVDEVGNRRARKVTGPKKPVKSASRAAAGAAGGGAASRRRAKPKAVPAPHPRGGAASSSITAAAATTSSRLRSPSEGGRADFFDPAERLENYYVSGEGLEEDANADLEVGADDGDFRPEDGEDEDDEAESAVDEEDGEAVAIASEHESEEELPRRPGARRAGGRGGWRGRR